MQAQKFNGGMATYKPISHDHDATQQKTMIPSTRICDSYVNQCIFQVVYSYIANCFKKAFTKFTKTKGPVFVFRHLYA